MRRGAATLLLAVFSFLLIGPSLSAEDPDANLPLCCRRNGKHHCSSMANSSSVPIFRAARCALFSDTATMVPVRRVAGLPAARPSVVAALTAYYAVPSYRQPLSFASYSRTVQDRAPPVVSY